MAIYEDVYGLTFNNAQKMQAILNQEIQQQAGVGFPDEASLKEWAHEHYLDKLVFSNMSHQFMCISHKGEIMLPKVYEHYYNNVLYFAVYNGKVVTYQSWHPDGFEYFDKACIAGEQSDGIHPALYYRNYCVPTGFYDVEKGAFNIAKPFPVFAKETGRDTSHIYTYIEHIAGECAMHLLAWLRAKLLYPTVKTQVVPIIVSRAQGSGKTTFAEVICKGLFGKDNVIVSDQYDATARFNADYADALIVCQEEKEETDRRNPAGVLKSRATATTIRKEQKGIDPIYQESYTDFIMTTNKDIPIKFDGREDQRRFMIMSADEHFTRKESKLADQVFSELYGVDANYRPVCTPFVDDKDLIAQFKHELFSNKKLADVELRNFPKTAAYKRCFTLPRTTEATEIEGIMRALAPFIKASLDAGKLVDTVDGDKLIDVIQYPGAMQFMPAYKDIKKHVALCRPLVFYEMGTNKPYAHSSVERTIYESVAWLNNEFGLSVMPDMEPLAGGFSGVVGRYRAAPAARFCLTEDLVKHQYNIITPPSTRQYATAIRKGSRLRVNKNFIPDSNGCFETVNEMKIGATSLKNKSKNVEYMDTFLLESDECTNIQRKLEQERIKKVKEEYGDKAVLKADLLYSERLSLSLSEARRLFDAGIACRIVYSGAKSYHILIRVRHAPTTIEEYNWLHGYLCNSLSDKIIFDASTCDPARLTRSPLTLPRVTMHDGVMVEGEQSLICEDWSHIYELDWRDIYEAWQNRPLSKTERVKGRRLMPTRKEYQDAAEAILDRSFWTDTKWDGERQRCFFAAYRILRLLGYKHDELWDGGVMTNGVEAYKHPNEIGYWRSRAKCALIRDIDTQIDEYIESFEED